jgi:hypothetical protein
VAFATEECTESSFQIISDPAPADGFQAHCQVGTKNCVRTGACCLPPNRAATGGSFRRLPAHVETPSADVRAS